MGLRHWGYLCGPHIIGFCSPWCFPSLSPCLLIKDVPSACICLVAGSSPWHLTAISADNTSMNFPAEIGFKRHVSQMFDIKTVLFIVFTSRAIHIKHSEKRSIFLSAEWGWHRLPLVLPPLLALWSSQGLSLVSAGLESLGLWCSAEFVSSTAKSHWQGSYGYLRQLVCWWLFCQ